MNSFFIFLVLGFTGVFAGPFNTREEYEACLKEYGVNLDPNNRKDANSEVPECALVCQYKQYGIMKPDGTIDPSKFMNLFVPDDIEAQNMFRKAYNACKDGNTGCDLVKCMNKKLP